ncbi:MAG: hypothetical protein KJ795_07640 [Gammaproteobacteria bacterium]|nr:hypothetical protein [Gammaproteobacteria bacterium]MBU1776490.1 hypothetical protein [Gammaproteobacteria bacterium]MBU1969859.1 hypothetical protein [Gammaproteobacteria bacterium]
MNRHIALILASALLLSACSPGDEDHPAPKLFEDQREALDKAKAVEDKVLDQAEQQRKAMEEQAR